MMNEIGRPGGLTFAEAQAETQALTDHYLYSSPLSPDDITAQNIEAASKDISEVKKLLSSVNDETFLDTYETVEEYNIQLSKGVKVELLDIDTKKTDESFDALVTAFVLGDEEETDFLLRQVGIKDEEAKRIILRNLEGFIADLVPASDAEENQFRNLLESNGLEPTKENLEYIIRLFNSNLPGERVKRLQQIPPTGEHVDKVRRVRTNLELLDQAIYILPYLDQERAVRLFDKALDGNHPSAASIVAIALPNISYTATQESLPLWRKAFNSEYEFVTSNAVDSANDVLEDTGRNISDEFKSRLRIILNGFYADAKNS